MNINKLWLVVGYWLLIIGFSLLLLHFFQFLDIGGSAATRDLEIKAGMSFDEVANKLKAENLIQSKTVFKIYGLITGQARQLKPGRYILATNISIPKLTKTLTDGPAKISVIIAPGMTLKEIDERLSDLAVIRLGDLTNFDVGSLEHRYSWLREAQSLEGFLLPDTYIFFLGSDPDLVVKKFLDNFELKVLPPITQLVELWGLPFFENSSNILKTINLASLLEKEIPDTKEQQIAAGILMKRLAVGMPLQVDAALVYGKCLGKFLNCPALREEDYRFDSPYNTYLYGGLPKTPICNPGPEAIKAALNPQKSDYWYYLSDPKTKKTVFSKTLDEHNKNRAKYLY